MVEVYRFKVRLKELETTIWRDIEITSSFSIADLCYSILATFKSEAIHFFGLNFGGDRFEIKFNGLDYFKGLYCPKNNKLEGMYLEEDDKMILEYDFGAGWEFEIILEEVRAYENENEVYPRLIDGKGKGIIEDLPSYQFINLVNESKAKGVKFINVTSHLCEEWYYEEFDLEKEKMNFLEDFNFLKNIYEEASKIV